MALNRAGFATQESLDQYTLDTRHDCGCNRHDLCPENVEKDWFKLAATGLEEGTADWKGDDHNDS